MWRDGALGSVLRLVDTSRGDSAEGVSVVLPSRIVAVRLSHTHAVVVEATKISVLDGRTGKTVHVIDSTPRNTTGTSSHHQSINQM